MRHPFSYGVIHDATDSTIQDSIQRTFQKAFQLKPTDGAAESVSPEISTCADKFTIDDMLESLSNERLADVVIECGIVENE